MERGEFISVAAASQVLGVSERTARRWCLAGKLRARKQGRAHIVDPVSVAELREQLSAGEGQQVPEIADTTPSPVLPAPPPLPLQEASGQLESGAREEPADIEVTLGQMKEALGPIDYQVRRLRSEVEEFAAVAEDLQQTNLQLRTTITTLQDILTVGAIAAVVLIIGLAVFHHTYYQHTSDREYARQQRQARATQATVEKRLTALEQAAGPKQGAAKADSGVATPDYSSLYQLRGTSSGTATQVKPEEKLPRPRPAWIKKHSR